MSIDDFDFDFDFDNQIIFVKNDFDNQIIFVKNDFRGFVHKNWYLRPTRVIS
jgi:hypothetical protein